MRLTRRQLNNIVSEGLFDFFFGKDKENQEQEPESIIPQLDLGRKRNISINQASQLAGIPVTEYNVLRDITFLGVYSNRRIMLVTDILGGKRLWYFSTSEKVPVEIEGFAVSSYYPGIWMVKSHWDKRPYSNTLEALIYEVLYKFTDYLINKGGYKFKYFDNRLNFPEDNKQTYKEAARTAKSINNMIENLGFDMSLINEYLDIQTGAIYTTKDENILKEKLIQKEQKFTRRKLNYNKQPSDYDTSQFHESYKKSNNSMKLTRRQLRSIIKETIEPKSFAEKIASMIESGDSSNIMLAMNFIQSGIFEDASEEEKRNLAQLFYNMTIGWWLNPPKNYRIMKRDLDDYMSDPDMDWVVSHSRAREIEEQLDIELETWFSRSKAIAELLEIHTQDLTGSSQVYLDFEDFYKLFYEAGIF